MRGRGIASAFNLTSRLWLAAAGLSLLLPPSTRLGRWLPLHLALAGAATVAISGNMQAFAATLTATAGPPLVLVRLQFVLVNAGVALIAIGYPTRHSTLVVAGGTCFLCGLGLLPVALRNAWRRSLNRRHAVPMATYGVAAAAVLVGGSIGALLGSGAVHDGGLWLALRNTHMAMNVLGWVSLTIAATQLTLLPTVLRIRMPVWRSSVAMGCLIGGLLLLSGGLATRVTIVAAAGAVAYLFGAAGSGWLAIAGIRHRPRSRPVPVSAKHMISAAAWFVFGALALAVHLLSGGSFTSFLPVFEAMFVCGWTLQVLLGAWMYLLPMARPGGPGERRVWLAALDIGANAQVGGLNLGLVLLTLRAADWIPGAAGLAGAWLALAAGAAGLMKTFAFPLIARAEVAARRSRRTWGL
jgi:nitrite reductase (NO-forming)